MILAKTVLAAPAWGLHSWRQPLLLALRSALDDLATPGANIACVDIPDAVQQELRAPFENIPAREFVADLDKVREQTQAKNLTAFGSFFDEVVREAAPTFDTRVIVTCRRWSDLPTFHVDEAAFTIVIPLLSAPTHFAPKSSLADIEDHAAEGLPLRMATRSAHASMAETKTSEGQVVVIKGLGWGAGHQPLVHSPPAASLMAGRKAHAYAVIVEAKRA